MTPVVFRKFTSEEFDNDPIIALFPCELGNITPFSCLCYQHIGQHDSAELDAVVKISDLATESEYKDLYSELQRQGYNDLKIMKRAPWNAFQKRVEKFKCQRT